MRNSLFRIAFGPPLVSSTPDRQMLRVKTAVRRPLKLDLFASDGDLHDCSNSSANIMPVYLGGNYRFFVGILFKFS
ncbi:hypothetical protein [uncultured Brevibacillus sp.]|uniref:hypothetical protein n=1 Tax=uncultured Brevibacillus sp. TaxID=169970 RepID=UPI002598D186|nr:hypothetical protein [uncultured Brevibacillus sp.]